MIGQASECSGGSGNGSARMLPARLVTHGAVLCSAAGSAFATLSLMDQRKSLMNSRVFVAAALRKRERGSQVLLRA